MNLSKDEIRKITEECPFLLPRNDIDDENKVDADYDYSYLCWTSEVPVGWEKLFLQMCMDIAVVLREKGLLNSFRFVQVKEKYNELRAYTENSCDEVDLIINKYGFVSSLVCQKCGKKAEVTTNGWISSYCKNCYDELSNKISYKEVSLLKQIDYDPILVITRNSKGLETVTKYDCSDILERLWK